MRQKGNYKNSILADNMTILVYWVCGMVRLYYYDVWYYDKGCCNIKSHMIVKGLMFCLVDFYRREMIT
jgi:hypothetical protein